jgi:hypothetical protein
VQPYTKSYSTFHSQNKVRVPYWYVPEDEALHFEWPSHLRKLGLPHTLSTKGISRDILAFTKPEFGNAEHAKVAATVRRQLQSIESRATSLSGGIIELSPMDSAPIYMPVEQLDLF